MMSFMQYYYRHRLLHVMDKDYKLTSVAVNGI